MNCVENLDGEIWKVIDGYSDYRISNKGRVMSVKFGEGKLRRLNKKTNGYLQVTLSKNGRRKVFLIHRLLATTFLPNPEGKPCVNHKIEGKEGKSKNFVFFKQDGSVDEERTTIEWVTHKENSNYGTCIDRKKETIKTSVAFKEGVKKRTKTKSKTVYQYNQNGEFVKVYQSTMEVERETGFEHTKISRCCNGKTKTSNGFVWSYIELTKNQILTIFEGKKRCKEVFQYRKTDLELVNIYPSVREAGRQTGFSNASIINCCHKKPKHKTAYGYIWSYEPIETSTNQLSLFPTTETKKKIS